MTVIEAHSVTDPVPNLAYDPALLFKVKQDLDKAIVGEDSNKLQLLLICVSRGCFPRYRLGAIIGGESSAGKSYLKNTILRYFPEDSIIRVTRMTGASLDRSQASLDGKILSIEELGGADAVLAQLRVSISEGKLNLWTTEKDPHGNITTTQIQTEGVPVFLSTTTAASADDETLNRIVILSVDESKEQTRKILEQEAREYMDIEDKWKPAPEIVEVLASLLIWPVLIPYAELLAKAFPADTVKARRDFRKLLNLITACTFLHQHQRPFIQDPSNKLKTFILATTADLAMVMDLADKSLRQTLLNLLERHLRVLSTFRPKEDKLERFLTAGQVAAECGLSVRRARDILRELHNKGFLYRNDEHKTHIWSLKKNVEDTAIVDLAAILSSFGQTELENFCKVRKLMLRQRDIEQGQTITLPTTYINPLTGETRNLLERTLSKTSQSRMIFHNPLDKDATLITTSASASTAPCCNFQQM